MSQDRLNILVLLSIERTLFEEIDFNDVIDDFATRKARKSTLLNTLDMLLVRTVNFYSRSMFVYYLLYFLCLACFVILRVKRSGSGQSLI